LLDFTAGTFGIKAEQRRKTNNKHSYQNNGDQNHLIKLLADWLIKYRVA